MENRAWAHKARLELPDVQEKLVSLEHLETPVLPVTLDPLDHHPM